jgi:hypothetical protein
VLFCGITRNIEVKVMHSFDDKINVLEKIVKLYKRSRDDFHIASLNKEVSILEEILEDEINLKIKDL